MNGIAAHNRDKDNTEDHRAKQCSQNKLTYRSSPGDTGDEIKELIHTMPQQKEITVVNEKHRKEVYKTVIESGDRSEIMRLVKTLYERREAQQKAGKKQHLVDERFMKEAETVLYDEFAFVLNIERDSVVEYIKNELKSL